MDVQHIAAFSDGPHGGNPAGVVIGECLPDDGQMQQLAATLGYSETVFAAPVADGAWRVRYFSPAAEVPFCGHATIALGAALARQHGDGTFALVLNAARITVEGRRDPQAADGLMQAALQSPPTRSQALDAASTAEALALFGLAEADLDPRLPPARIHGGADHFLLALRDRTRLSAMRYDFEAGRELMQRAGLATIVLAHAETPQRFHVRNPFAGGGVYEDPATGAAAAALGGYLRDRGWPHGGSIAITQGEDMGVLCRLQADIGPTAGESVRVRGAARMMAA
ncbi:PhzF family phenazine biosynthesis protein [Pseudacidovorax intermedius]|uniref:PhzF family phenazine biosynthesis protein n=1 Tax=Pseudacidovorax intermedius TaxID=433924 RepID=A0A147GQA5_9BURK|nr:PhzF family phenazine biosynthesis protein [Pseudacidovorax intermedius]KTT17749.1 PhzF family phenazine biosynthesis protein [Pseudacidovorax intermedius]